MKNLATKYKTILDNGGINTPLRLAHFFAQIDHESLGGKRLREIGNAKYFERYEGRKDLGNTQKGDGIRFIGRGYIQVTGRANYTELSKATGIDYVNNPQWLEREADAMTSAIWFWQTRRLNRFADADDIRGVTRRINGGFNGLQDRINKLAKYKADFGIK